VWGVGPHLRASQQFGEAEGSLTLETQGQAGAAPSKPGPVSTARWSGSGERDRQA
jgi:hypothetical protein